MTLAPDAAREWRMKEIDLRVLLKRVLSGWATVVAFAIIGVAYTLATLPSKHPVYRVVMSVSPAPSAEAGMSGGNSVLGTLLSLGGGSSSSSDYTNYQLMLVSTSVAQRLIDKYGLLQVVFSNQWNSKTKTWHPPHLTGFARLVAEAKEPLLRLAHIKSWHRPDATDLAAYLKQHLLISPSTQNDVVTIEFDSGDVPFAKKIMLLAHKEANEVLAGQVARHARQEARYLERKLAQTKVEDYRSALITMLSQQEKMIMLTQTDASFAAEILNPPTASQTPISPRPVLSVFVSALVGMILGTLMTMFIGPNWWRSLTLRLRNMIASLLSGRLSDALSALWSRPSRR